MKRIITLCLTTLLAVFFMSGCTPPEIVVVDEASKPIEGADITGVSLSISGQKTKTDKNGCASIPWSVQETKWIYISKEGYESIGNIDVNQTKPIRVVLRKKANGEP